MIMELDGSSLVKSRCRSLLFLLCPFLGLLRSVLVLRAKIQVSCLGFLLS